MKSVPHGAKPTIRAASMSARFRVNGMDYISSATKIENTLRRISGVVLHRRVLDVAAMVDLSKRTMINIRQNVNVALCVKEVFFVTTVGGLTVVWPAILADTGATVLITFCALWLLRPNNCPSSTGKANN